MLERDTKKTLYENSVRLKKKYGQNFCIDSSVIDDIVKASKINNEDTVLEIGPGAGVLTKELAKTAKKVIAVEIDDEMVKLLQKELKDFDNIDIINQDIMKWKGLSSLPKGTKVVANLPYYITTPILIRLLEEKSLFDRITIMVQKEVGQRLCAKPSGKAYGAITLAVNYSTCANLVRIVDRKAFLPPPNVDSAVVTMKVLDKPQVYVSDETKLNTLIRTSFLHRRKTLINSLSASNIFSLGKEKIKTAIEKSGFKPNIRAENLSLEDFARLLEFLLK